MKNPGASLFFAAMGKIKKTPANLEFMSSTGDRAYRVKRTVQTNAKVCVFSNPGDI